MRAGRSRSQYALRWDCGRPARNPDHATLRVEVKLLPDAIEDSGVVWAFRA